MRPAFPVSEHRERLQRARIALQQAGLDGCICVAPEHLYYIGGYEAHTHFSEQGLVFTAGEDEPTLLVREVDLPLVHETSWLKDVRVYHFGSQDPAEVIAEIAEEKGILGKRIGLDLGSYALTGAYAFRLAKELGPSTIKDSTQVIGILRLIKSSKEVEYIRKAAICANAGLEAIKNKARRGITEIQLAGEIEYALRTHGSDYMAMPTWLAAGPRSPAGHAQPTDRVLEPGDVIHVEFSGLARRYPCLAIKTYSMGQPSERAQELHEAAKESLLAGLKAIKVGGPVSAAEEASLRPLNGRGLARYAPMRFGVGISAVYPPNRLEPLSIFRESTYLFKPGMVFYLHTCLQVPDDNIGILVGGSYLMTEQGPEQLDNGTPDLTILSPN